MIGFGKQDSGLYLFSILNVASLEHNTIGNIFCTSISIPQSALWHFRFGHTSLAKL